jgi:hypothetical protein
MIALLKEYSDYFALDYTEMPRLDKSIGSLSRKDFGHFSNEHVK